jgi:CRP-like cAMP-binding protein
MKIVPELKKFINFNQIDDESLRAAAGYIYHKHYKQGTVICQEGENSECFFGIIRGKVSIRKRKRVENRE